jgi:dihydrofolate reductase/thymidylate synthase
MTLNLILASSYPTGAIGESSGLPWSLPGDLAYFRRITTRRPSAIIMGRRTWESFGSKPLPRRKNIVISAKLCDVKQKDDANVVFVRNLPAAIDAISEGAEAFVIGGAALYAEAARYSGPQPGWVSPYASARPMDVKIYHTEVYARYPNADVYWKIPDGYCISHAGPLESVVDDKSGVLTWFRRFEWVRAGPVMPDIGIPLITHCVNPEEKQYLDLLKNALENGALKTDRTGTGTLSIFGAHLHCNLQNGFPAITTKPLFWKGVVEELLWLLSGDTNAKHLASVGVHIWDLDTSREKLDERGRQHLIEGDAGATYGHNMRHYGAPYTGCMAEYSGLGYDQLAECVRLLQQDPSSRRIIINLWNPAELNNCALPPCLTMYQFYVSCGKLSCFLTQRSADLMLGVPFNRAASALFTHILANMCDLIPWNVDHNMCDAHVYSNHVEAAREQIARSPYPKCRLEMPTNADGSVKKLTLADIDAKPRQLTHRDFKLVGYRHHPALENPTPMAA